MTIGGISDYGFMYNNYSVNRIPSVDVNQVDKLPEKQAQQKDIPAKESTLQDIPLQVDRPSVNLEDVSLTFNKDETFDYLGSDSSLASLDMDKAISDMKKDQILQDYQYFVGSTPASIQSFSEDGIVIAK